MWQGEYSINRHKNFWIRDGGQSKWCQQRKNHEIILSTLTSTAQIMDNWDVRSLYFIKWGAKKHLFCVNSPITIVSM